VHDWGVSVLCHCHRCRAARWRWGTRALLVLAAIGLVIRFWYVVLAAGSLVALVWAAVALLRARSARDGAELDDNAGLPPGER
jgi:uncharacterized membrane protein